MPTTLGGAAIFVLLLTPGLVHVATRRAHLPVGRNLSPLLETGEALTVSVVAHASTALLLGVFRSFPWGRGHSPDVAQLLQHPAAYTFDGHNSRLSYVLGWTALGLVISCLLAYGFARQWGPVGWVARRFAPTIVASSAWYSAFFGDAPAGGMAYVGCTLKDGGYVAGYFARFSTDSDETEDRDLILAPPFQVVRADGGSQDLGEVQRMLLSARDIGRIDVSYVAK